MALDQELVTRVRERLGSMTECEEKAIVGGIGFMLRGRLICGVVSKGFLVRVGNPNGRGFLGEDGASPMVLGGRSSGGWLVVPGSSVRSTTVLEKWMSRAMDSFEVAGRP